MALAEQSAGLHAVHSGQVHVHQHQVGAGPNDGGQRLLGRLHRADDLEAVNRGGDRAGGLPERSLVVDDQHAHRHCGFGHLRSPPAPDRPQP